MEEKATGKKGLQLGVTIDDPVEILLSRMSLSSSSSSCVDVLTASVFKNSLTEVAESREVCYDSIR